MSDDLVDGWTAGMVAVFILGLVYLAARSVYRWWRAKPLSRRRIRRLRADAELYMRGASASRPAPVRPNIPPGAGPEPHHGSASVVADSVEPRPAPGLFTPGAGPEHRAAAHLQQLQGDVPTAARTAPTLPSLGADARTVTQPLAGDLVSDGPGPKQPVDDGDPRHPSSTGVQPRHGGDTTEGVAAVDSHQPSMAARSAA